MHFPPNHVRALFLPLLAILLGFNGCKEKTPVAPRQAIAEADPEARLLEKIDKPDFAVFANGKPLTSIILSESAKNAPILIGHMRHSDIPDDVPNDIVWAVELFRQDLKNGYGIEIPLGETADVPNRIEIDLVETSVDKEDEISVSFPEPNVLRIRGGQSGIIRTLFVLLEKYAGVRYLFQGGMDGPGLGVYYPPLDSLAIPERAFTRSSAFTVDRSASQTTYGSHWKADQNRLYWWNWEARLGSKARASMEHSLPDVAFPLEQYASAKTKPSEAIFPIQNGKRILPWKDDVRKNSHWQPDFDNPATEDEAVKNILAYLDAHPNTTGFSLAVNDGGGFSDQARGSESESYYSWVNAVAERVTKKYPNVLFGVAAYREVERPPNFPLHPNVITYITLDFQSTADPDVLAKKKMLIAGWKKAGRFGVYSYNTGDTTYTLPRIYFHEMQQMIRHLHQEGAEAAFTERSYTTAAEGPKMYVYQKLLENPDLNLDATITDWCEAAVGKSAAGDLRQYYTFWDNFWRKKAVQTNWWKSSKNSIYLSLPPFGAYMYALEAGDMAKCRSLMENVVKQALANGTADQKKRAEFLMKTFEWYEANAMASSGEFFNPNGSLPDARTAAAFIRNLPEADAAFKKSVQIPLETKAWIAPKITTSGLDAANPVIASMAAVGSFLDDPGVVDELRQLAVNPKASPKIRFLADIMAKSASGDDSGNLVKDGDFSTDDHGGFLRAPEHGKIERSSDHAVRGAQSLKCTINHSNFTLEFPIPKGKVATDYYLSAKVYIPESQAVAEGRLNIWGQGTYHVGDKIMNRGKTRNIPDIILNPGQWNYVSATIPGAKLTDSLRAGITLKSFEEGDVVYIDDLRVYEIPSSKAP